MDTIMRAIRRQVMTRKDKVWTVAVECGGDVIKLGTVIATSDERAYSKAAEKYGDAVDVAVDVEATKEMQEKVARRNTRSRAARRALRDMGLMHTKDGWQ
jgi:hypothetical protein